MVINFGAGPAKLPAEVLKEVQQNVINYENTGLSVMEMSHRSADYMKIQSDALKAVQEIL